MSHKPGQWRTSATAHIDSIDTENADGIPLFDIEVIRRARWRRWEVRLRINAHEWLLCRSWSEDKAVQAAAIETDIALGWLHEQGWL